MKWFRSVIALLLFLSLLLPAQAAAGKSYTAERFDVNLVIETDGALLVTETIAFEFTGGPYTYALRQLDRTETDAIEVLGAAMDGVDLPRGSSDSQVEITDEDNLINVRWHFEPTSDRVRIFTLQYRVHGATRVSNGADLVKWYAIPADHEYAIGSSTIVVQYPPDRTPSGPISLSGGGWDIETAEGTIVASARDIPADQSVLLNLSFPGGSLLTQPPAWQAKQIERSRQTGAAFPWAAALGLTCLILGGSGLALVWRNNHPEPAQGFSQGVISRPPNDLRPGLAGALFTLPSVPLELAVATLMDLARRGWIRIEQSGKKSLFGSYPFTVVREPEVKDTSLRPYEQTLYDLIFDRQPGRRQGEDEVALSKSIERAQRGLSIFSKDVIATMDAGGWMDAERKKKRQKISILGLTGAIVFLLVFMASLWMIGAVGEQRAYEGTFGMAVSIAGFALSLAALIMAGNWHVLSARGLAAREQWREFGDFLKAQIRSKETPLQADWLDAYLADAVALRFGDRWAKAFQDRNIRPELAWLRAMDDLQAASVMACIAASSGGDGGAGASAGGGGGGSSSAG